MTNINNEELKVILENHMHWLNEDCDRWEQMCADLHDANLRGANLRNADLCNANLRGANLRNANLCNANLCNANLRNANLCNANLRNADLHDANLCNANLCNADLRGANLRGANLRGANLCNAGLCNTDLCNANLCNANLRNANLCNANLCNANLRGANLCNADLCNAENIPFIPMTCPDTGEFIGWKKAVAETNCGGYYCIVKLFIPTDAKRSSATGRKCRCDKAVVVDIEVIGYDEKEPITILRCYSNYDENFTYEIHKTVSVDNFDENRFNECAPGIHFFINKQEAIDY